MPVPTTEAAREYFELFKESDWLQRMTSAQLEHVAEEYWRAYWEKFHRENRRLMALK